MYEAFATLFTYRFLLRGGIQNETHVYRIGWGIPPGHEEGRCPEKGNPEKSSPEKGYRTQAYPLV